MMMPYDKALGLFLAHPRPRKERPVAYLSFLARPSTLTTISLPCASTNIYNCVCPVVSLAFPTSLKRVPIFSNQMKPTLLHLRFCFSLTQVVSVRDDEGEVESSGILQVQARVQILVLRAPHALEFRIICPVNAMYRIRCTIMLTSKLNNTEVYVLFASHVFFATLH